MIPLLGFSPMFWVRFAIYAAVFSAGAWAAHKFHQAEQLAAVNAARVKEQNNFKLVVRTETKVQERIRKVYVRGKEIVHEVPKIITVEVEGACPAGLPAGFVRLHDDAATGSTPGPATESDARPAGVTLAQAGETIADNYTEYRACREQVIGWQRFYRDLRRGK